jgi:FKBP-type peptidyl-prolyl cis-trans isomerase FkpA
MKNIFAIVISTLALTAFAADGIGPKKPCKEGQTEADGCHVVKKAEKKVEAKPTDKKVEAKPAEKKADTKPVEVKAAEKPAAKPADKPAEKK